MSDNPFMDRMTKGKGSQSKGYQRAPKQEKKIAKKLGGHTILGSGSGRRKGDVQAGGIARIECKCTQHKSFSVTRDMIDKIRAAAACNDEVAAIHIEFLDELGKVADEVYVVLATDLEELITRG